MAQSFAKDDPAAAPSPRLELALERLDALVDWERRERTARMRVTVEPSRALLERLGRPQQRFCALHIAGTKGKGSVAALVAAGLRELGASTGTYSSPHVERVNERVCLGAEPIDDEALSISLEAALDALDAAHSGDPAEEATWFDVLTAAAFHAFERAKVDFGVIECGLGGRLDSTNVLAAPVCVITNIGLEHTAILGDTREAIAREKAGVIGPGASVVMGSSETDPAGREILEIARAKGASIHAVAPAEGASIDELNQTLAARVLDELGRRVGERHPAVGHGVGAWGSVLGEAVCRAARLPGRLERRRVAEVPVILDGAHTPESLEACLRDLENDPELPGRLVCVFGTGGEKNAPLLLKVLRPRTDSVLCTSVGPGPYRAPEELRSMAQELGIDAMAIETPRAALDEALRLAGREGYVLVTGSLHLVGAVRRFTRS